MQSIGKRSRQVPPARPKWRDNRFSLGALTAVLTICCVFFALVRLFPGIGVAGLQMAAILALLLGLAVIILVVSLAFLSVVMLVLLSTVHFAAWVVLTLSTKSYVSTAQRTTNLRPTPHPVD